VPYLVVALLEAVAAWWIAARVFEARDVAVPVE
jgi:hypothetical protein